MNSIAHEDATAPLAVPLTVEKSALRGVKDLALFFREFLTEFRTTGSFTPTSRFAAEALTWPLRASRGPQRILEVGPGTGSVTARILSEMDETDELVICEINPRFMGFLCESLLKDANYQIHKSRVSFFTGPIQNLPESFGKFDVIVSAVPFLNFELDTVHSIFEKYRDLSSSSTVLTYYEYIGLRTVGLLIPLKQRQQRLHSLHNYFKELFACHLLCRSKVWLNCSPINIYSLQMSGEKIPQRIQAKAA